MNPPDGPFKVIADQVRRKREQVDRAERLRAMAQALQRLEREAVELGLSNIILAQLIDARCMIEARRVLEERRAGPDDEFER